MCPPTISLEGRALPIFPCFASKKPSTPRGFKNASADREAIAELWRRYPAQLVGVPTGEASALAVIDLDPRSGSDIWF